MAYVQHTDEDVRRMLEVAGVNSVEDLFAGVPAELRLDRPLRLPPRQSESEIVRSFQKLADRNSRIDTMPSFLGAGVYDRFIPAAVDYLSSRGEFNTAYTPYQPEVSQGTLQAIFEYQTLIARLTGMELSNASMYEAATAVVEAALMAYAVHGKGKTALVSQGLHPDYRHVLETYFRHHPIRLETVPLTASGRTDVDAITEFGADGSADDDVFAFIGQSPNFFGVLENGPELRRAIDERNGKTPLFVQTVDPISLGLVNPPGSYGADIAIGDGQALGNDPNLGGPTFGFFATRHAHVRKVPGRIVGETKDRDGKRGYVLTFQTREQHIRRDRATSNICTNQGLCCLRGAMSMVLLGEGGIRAVAEYSTRLAHYAARRICALAKMELTFDAPFFQEFVVDLPLPARSVYRDLLARGIRGGLPLDRFFPARTHQMMFAVTELTTKDDVDALCEALDSITTGAVTAPGPSGADPGKSNGERGGRRMKRDAADEDTVGHVSP